MDSCTESAANIAVIWLTVLVALYAFYIRRTYRLTCKQVITQLFWGDDRFADTTAIAPIFLAFLGFFVIFLVI